MMSLGARTRYLYEPFNFHSGLQQIRRYFEVPGSGGFTMEAFDDIVAGIRRLDLDLKSGLFPEDRGLRRLVKLTIGGRSRVSYLLCRLDRSLQTLIWKDPIAVFASLAAAQRHQIPVLVTVRNPIAVAASFRRMRWAFDLADLNNRLSALGVDQSALIDRYRASLDRSIVNGAVLWRLIYSVILDWGQESELIRVVNIGDIIRQPALIYRRIYEQYALPWSQHVERVIEKKYAPVNKRWVRSSADLPKRAHVAGRDVSELNSYGEKLLEPDEIKLIEEITGDLWSSYQSSPIKITG
jgi:hypothetical protein